MMKANGMNNERKGMKINIKNYITKIILLISSIIVLALSANHMVGSMIETRQQLETLNDMIERRDAAIEVLEERLHEYDMRLHEWENEYNEL